MCLMVMQCVILGEYPVHIYRRITAPFKDHLTSFCQLLKSCNFLQSLQQSDDDDDGGTANTHVTARLLIQLMLLSTVTYNLRLNILINTAKIFLDYWSTFLQEHISAFLLHNVVFNSTS